MLVVPLQALPAQQVTTSLGGYRYRLRVYSRTAFLFETTAGLQPLLGADGAQLLGMDGAPLTADPRLGQGAARPRPALYMDIAQGDAVLLSGALCLWNTLVVRDAYLGIAGDFVWIDMLGRDDPQWDGIGSRWFLTWQAVSLPAVPVPVPSVPPRTALPVIAQPRDIGIRLGGEPITLSGEPITLGASDA